MSIIGKILRIAEKNNAQLYWHNGLTPNWFPVLNYVYKQALSSLRSLVGYVQLGDNRTNMITFSACSQINYEIARRMHAVLQQAYMRVYFMVKPNY